MSEELIRVAMVNANIASAMIEAEAMKAANRERKDQREAPAYAEDDFMRLIQKHGIHSNAVTSFLRNF